MFMGKEAVARERMVGAGKNKAIQWDIRGRLSAFFRGLLAYMKTHALRNLEFGVAFESHIWYFEC